MTSESIDKMVDLLIPYFGKGPYLSFIDEGKILKRFQKKGIKAYSEKTYRGKSTRYKLTLEDGEFEISLMPTVYTRDRMEEARRVTHSLLIFVDETLSGIDGAALKEINGFGWAFSYSLTLSVTASDPTGMPLYVFATESFVIDHPALFPS